MSEEQKDTQEQQNTPKDGVIIRDVTVEGASKTKELKFERTFIMELTEEDGTHRVGEFTVKRLNLGELGRVGVMRAQLNSSVAEEAISVVTHNLHEWIAYCTYAVVKAPEWFKPTEMFDATALSRVYQEARAFNASFRK